MTRDTVTISAIAFLCIAAAPLVTFISPCDYRDNHGQHRWSVKINPSVPPEDANAIQAVTPSDIYSWSGPDVPFTRGSERTGIENKWFALTRRVVAVRVEQTAIFTSRFKMRLAINRESLLLKYQPSRSGVKFATRFFAYAISFSHYL